MKYKIGAEQYAEIKAAQKANRDKQIENRLKVLALRYEGKSLEEITDATGYHHAHISNLIRLLFVSAMLSAPLLPLTFSPLLLVLGFYLVFIEE